MKCVLDNRHDAKGLSEYAVSARGALVADDSYLLRSYKSIESICEVRLPRATVVPDRAKVWGGWLLSESGVGWMTHSLGEDVYWISTTTFPNPAFDST